MELLNYEILNASGDADKNSLPMFSCNTYPCFLDLSFNSTMSVHDVAVVFSDDVEVNFCTYWSIDGVNFYKMPKSPVIARYVRIFIKYYSGAHPTINNVEILGEKCNFPSKKTPFKEPLPFCDTEYNKEITDEDIIDDVKGIIKRTIGEKYIEQFDLRLDYRLKSDYFTVESLRGTIRLISNSGVGLASAFNCYLKEVCKCHISRFGNQVKLPQNLPQVDGKIHKETEFKYRYAYNYCAHSYSMALWGFDEWQKEIDFLAMNGVNLVLDITGMEEVYRRFLTKIGYRHREIKNFLSGPYYFAWLYMGNVTNIGGPLHDNFFIEKCELARFNQRRMRVLGMDIVLQGYMGMIPSDIAKKDRDVPIIPQGQWGGIDRPYIIAQDSVSYVKYAELFYEAQKEVYGDITHFYAGDICHEGGKLGDINPKEAFQNIIQSMMTFDKDAIWVIQSWGLNPTKKFTKYMKPYRDNHILMLDLQADVATRNENKFSQLAKYNCLFGMINSFGGRMGLYGNIDKLAEKINTATKRDNFSGIALTSESNIVNPIVTDLFFETVWNKIDDIQKWTYDYAERRYGIKSENIEKSMDLLLKTCYADKNYGDGEGAPECGICCRPEGTLKKASSWGSTKINYSESDFEKAVKLFLKEYDKLKANKCYIYDAVDMLRQAIANRITHTVKSLQSAYDSKDYLVFCEFADKLLELAMAMDNVLLNCKDFSFASYIERVDEYTEKLDDFTRDLYILDAKMLVTTWGPRATADDGKLHDYTNRQLGDLIKDFYLMRWQKFIDNVKIEMDGGKPSKIDWFKVEWDWVLSDLKYTKRMREDSLKAISKQILGE